MAVYAKAARGEDEPSALAGLGLIEDGESLIQALQAKSWLAGSLAGLGGALDMADLARDPFGKLLSWGLAWVIEHFSPLKDWLNDLTGNPGEVRAFSQTWSSIGGSLNENSAVLARAVNEDMDGAEGVTIAAYRSHQTDMSRHIGMVGGLSEGMATSLLGVSVAVQVVHDLVRDRISDTVSSLAKYAVMEFLSLGALTPFVIEDVASQVLHSATVLRGHIKDLFHSGHALGQLADGAKNVLTKFKNALANHSGAGVRKAAGQADDAAPALANALGRGKSFNPPPPKPLVPGGSVERRVLYNGGPKGNGAYADFHLDAHGNKVHTDIHFDSSNIVRTRQDPDLARMDRYDRGQFGDTHADTMKNVDEINPRTGEKLTIDAGHDPNANLIAPVERRVLDDTYNPNHVFGGKHAEAAEPLDKVRGMITDPHNGITTIHEAKKHLSPLENKALDNLMQAERNLGYFPQASDINRGSYRVFEDGILKETGVRHIGVDYGSWVKGRPESVSVNAYKTNEDGALELFASREFPN